MIQLSQGVLERINRKFAQYGEIYDAIEGGSREDSTIAWNIVKNIVLERDSYRCRICGRSPFKTEENGNINRVRLDLEVHHIIPRIAGGSDSTKNLVTLCKSCHVKTFKSDYEGLPYNPELKLTVEVEIFTNSERLKARGLECRNLRIDSFYYKNEKISLSHYLDGFVCKYFGLNSAYNAVNNLELELDEIIIKNEKGKFCIGLIENSQ